MTEPKWYDITVSKAKCPEEILRKWLDENGERYAYGRERGEDGYEHFQVRVVLRNPTSWETMREIWGHSGHCSPTHTRNFDYVLKEGDFVCSWIKVPDAIRNAQLRPWQQHLVNLKQNDREVDCIIDLRGNTGKSFVTKYMCMKNMAINIPSGLTGKDIMRMCMKRPKLGTYIFDIPRAGSKQAKETWSAIESIKNGYMWDDRYTWEEMWVDSPRVFVFTNEYPKYDLLSEDRFRFWAPGELGLVQLAK